MGSPKKRSGKGPDSGRKKSRRGEHERQKGSPLGGESFSNDDPDVSGIRHAISDYLFGAVEEGKTIEQIESENLRATVLEKIKKFPATVRTGHPELPEAPDPDTKTLNAFAERLESVCPDDIEAWSSFSKFIDRYQMSGTMVLEFMLQASGKKKEFLKLFLEVSLNEGRLAVETLAHLRDALYRDDCKKLIAARDILMPLSKTDHHNHVLNNTNLFKGSFDKFQHFVEYVRRSEKFNAAEAEAFIEGKMKSVDRGPYR